eukprot:scaffold13097_cov59-Phaeocystis_antarctica.AAC.7
MSASASKKPAPSRPHRPSARRLGRAPSRAARSSAGARSPERRPVCVQRVREEVARISIRFQATQQMHSRETAEKGKALEARRHAKGLAWWPLIYPQTPLGTREVFVAVGRRVDQPLHHLLVHEDRVQLRDRLVRLRVPLHDRPLPVFLGLLCALSDDRLCALLGVLLVILGWLSLLQQPCMLEELWEKRARLCALGMHVARDDTIACSVLQYSLACAGWLY